MGRGIVDQVQQYLLDPPGIGLNHYGRVREREVNRLGGERLGHLHDMPGQHRQIERLPVEGILPMLQAHHID
jgi:hypothetical protein